MSKNRRLRWKKFKMVDPKFVLASPSQSHCCPFSADSGFENGMVHQKHVAWRMFPLLWTAPNGMKKILLSFGLGEGSPANLFPASKPPPPINEYYWFSSPPKGGRTVTDKIFLWELCERKKPNRRPILFSFSDLSSGFSVQKFRLCWKILKVLNSDEWEKGYFRKKFILHVLSVSHRIYRVQSRTGKFFRC